MREFKEFRPLSNRVVIQLDERDKAIGSVLLPDNFKSDSFAFSGRIIAQGPGKQSPNISKERLLKALQEAGADAGSFNADLEALAERMAAAMKNDGYFQPPPTKVGERVIFSKFAGNEVFINGKEHRIVDPNDIMACVDDEVQFTEPVARRGE